MRTELLALRTVRGTWLLVGAAVLVTAALAAKPVLGAGKAGAPSIGTAGALLAVLGAAGRGSPVVLLLGVLTVTAEFRHGTITATFLRTPHRRRVLAAKAAAVAVVGGALAAVDLAVVAAIGLGSGAIEPALLNADIMLHVLGLLATYPLYGVVGVGLGALIGYQPVAMVLPLAWMLFVEDLTLHLLPGGAATWSMGGVTAALANAGDVARVLPMAAGGAVLLGYAVLLLSLGAARVAHRDIT